MNTNYNPYAAALAAAAVELTSARAHRFYSIRAQQDTQAAICAAVTVGCWVYQIAALAFQLGSAARQYFSPGDAPASTATSQQPVQQRLSLVLMPAPAPIALLPASAQPLKPSLLPKLPSHSLSKTELIIQIQQRSLRKVPGVWKMRRDALEQIYAGV